MRLLHTSDWHLGRRLFQQARTDEFDAFLTWLYDTIVEHEIDTLLIAGDIFDTTTPSTTAQSMYWSLLGKLQHTCCQDVIVIAGNHDNAGWFEGHKDFVKHLRVHVLGHKAQTLDEHIAVLPDKAVVALVPYLRETDLQELETGLTHLEKTQRYVQAIKAFYHEVLAHAHQVRDALEAQTGQRLPIVATGHLFAQGGHTVSEDGVRDLYVGTAPVVGLDVWADQADYVALGHLHQAQKVAGSEIVRYSGSPLPMSFQETDTKVVLMVDLNAQGVSHIEPLAVPVFRQWVHLQGTWQALQEKIAQLPADQNLWIDLALTDLSTSRHDWQQLLESLQANPRHRLARAVRVLNQTQPLWRLQDKPTLESLSQHDVFEQVLDAHLPLTEDNEKMRQAVKDCFSELLDMDKSHTSA